MLLPLKKCVYYWHLDPDPDCKIFFGSVFGKKQIRIRNTAKEVITSLCFLVCLADPGPAAVPGRGEGGGEVGQVHRASRYPGVAPTHRVRRIHPVPDPDPLQ